MVHDIARYAYWLVFIFPRTAFTGSILKSPKTWLLYQWQGLVITTSGLFDRQWYSQQNPDVAGKKINPFLHYLHHGTEENRWPNPFFDPAYYLGHYPDVAWSGLNPLFHFHVNGWREGRRPSMAFDTQAYLERYPDVGRTGLNPLLHYLQVGMQQGRLPGRYHPGSLYTIVKFDPATGGVLVFPSFDDVQVTIIIPVHNQFMLTMGCLKAILANTSGIAYEVVLIDDVSTDEVAVIERYARNITIIRNTVNEGFLRNCNKAAARARGEFLVLLNSDTNVQKDWLSWLLRTFEANPDAGVAGPMMLFDDGVVQEAGVVVYSNAECWCYGRDDSNPFRPEYQFVREADYVSGACLLIPVSLWRDLSGFDDMYAPAYAEDMDLCFRVRASGFKVYYQPKAVVVHFEGRSYGEVTGARTDLMKRNRQVFTARWQEVLLRDHPAQPADKGPPAELFLARDRSYCKAHVFVSDSWVPEHDRNAGARCTRQYLELFHEMGFQVTFHPRDNQRREPYATELEQAGIEVLLDVDATEWMKLNLKYFDYIYLHRPEATTLLESIETSKRPDARIIYFAHDLYHIRLRRQYQLEKQKALLVQAERFESKEREMFEAADVIHVAGEHEAGLLRSLYPAKPVRDIPLFIFSSKTSCRTNPLPIEDRSGLLFVGSFGHAPNRDAVRWLMREVWPKFSRKIPGVDLIIAGSNPTAEIEGYRAERVQVTGWISDEQLVSLYSTCRLLVMPLRFGAGVKGKVLEAMYHGIPVMTTPVGAEGIADAERVLFVERCSDNWSEELIRRYGSTAELERRAIDAHALLMEKFSRRHAEEVLRQDMRVTGSC